MMDRAFRRRKFIPTEQELGREVSTLEGVMTTSNSVANSIKMPIKPAVVCTELVSTPSQFLSEWTKTEVKRDGHLYQQEYSREQGNRTRASRGKATGTGTKVSFKPDPLVFKSPTGDRSSSDYEILRQRLQQLAFLNRGCKITLSDERSGQSESFCPMKKGSSNTSSS